MGSPVNNPLYDGDAGSLQRAVPRGNKHKSSSSTDGASPHEPAAAAGPGKCRTCWSFTPKLMVLAVAILIAAQVTWFVYAERYINAAQKLLVQLKVLPPTDLSHGMFILKAVLLGVTSFLGLVMLLLGVAVKRQRLAKRAAASRADWPHGFKSHATVGVSSALCILLWLIAAGFVVLLCCTFTATGVALAGDVAAQQAVSLAANRPPALANAAERAQASLTKAKTAFQTAANAAPPFIRKTPWYTRLTSTVLPPLSAGGDGDGTVEQAACPASCLNLRLITALLPASDNSTSTGCVCVKQAIQEGQQLLNRMWKDGIAAMAALATLASMATWLLVYCLVACMITQRDHIEAKHCKSMMAQQHDGQHGADSIWMWQHGAGVASPHSASDTMSSFPAIEPAGGGGGKRTPQVLSPSSAGKQQQHKRGSGMLPHHHQQQHQQLDQEQQRRQGSSSVAVVDHQADDIERPAVLQPDQLPTAQQPRAPANTLHNLDDLQGGASRREAARQQQPSASDRRRW